MKYHFYLLAYASNALTKPAEGSFIVLKNCTAGACKTERSFACNISKGGNFARALKESASYDLLISL